MIIKSEKLHNSAKGQDYTLRLPGICNFNSETVILAHVPCGMSGMGMKGPDIIAAYLCSDCHDVLDQRKSLVEVDGWDVIRAVAETQCRMVQAGLIKVMGADR